MNQSSWHDINEPGVFKKKTDGGPATSAEADETPEPVAKDQPEVRCALPCLDGEGKLIAAMVSAFSYAKNHADRELIVEGHARIGLGTPGTIYASPSAALRWSRHR